MSGLTVSDRVISVDNEVRGIDIVTFAYHLKDLWLMNCSLFHKLNNFILMSDGMIDIMVQLNLNFVFELTSLVHEVLILWDCCEVFTILGQKIELGDVSPRVEFVSHGVHGPNTHILATSKKVHLVDLPIKRLPVKSHRHPGEAIGKVEKRKSNMPFPHQGIDEENVPTEGHG